MAHCPFPWAAKLKLIELLQAFCCFKLPCPILWVKGKEEATWTDGDGISQILIPVWLQDGESCHRTCDSGAL